MSKELNNQVPAKIKLLLVTLCLMTAACTTVGPDFHSPKTNLQESWSVTTDMEQTMPTSAAFWSSFQDETLTELIALANANSPTLEKAAQAIIQAQAQLYIDKSSSLPSVNMVGANQYQQPTPGSLLKGQNEGANTQQLMGQLSWEIDFWGKSRRTIESGTANLQMAEASLAAAKISLEASVASTYSTIRLLEKRIAVANANLAEQAENLRIAKARYNRGATSELDLRQSETQYEFTNSQLPDLQIALEQNQHAISILLGEAPNYYKHNYMAGKGLPTLPAMLPLGAPSDLLRRRPDVMQAEYAAAAQSARIGVTKAALYPSFTLNGSVGVSTTDGINNLFKWDSRAASYGLGFNLPLFDRGRIAQQVKVQDSLFAEALLTYQHQVINAQKEVEDALSSINGYKKQLGDVQRADKAAKRSADLARSQYRAGQVDYITVSSAEQAQLQTSDSVVQIEGGLLQAYIGAFRALGGGWDAGDRGQMSGISKE